MRVKDIEINTLQLDVNFILENGSVIEHQKFNSENLSDTTLTKIFDDLSNIKVQGENNEKNSFVGEDGVKTTFEDTDWGDDSQVDISGDEVKDE